MRNGHGSDVPRDEDVAQLMRTSESLTYRWPLSVEDHLRPSVRSFEEQRDCVGVNREIVFLHVGQLLE
jgi:hypothetical protein